MTSTNLNEHEQRVIKPDTDGSNDFTGKNTGSIQLAHSLLKRI